MEEPVLAKDASTVWEAAALPVDVPDLAADTVPSEPGSVVAPRLTPLFACRVLLGFRVSQTSWSRTFAFARYFLEFRLISRRVF